MNNKSELVEGIIVCLAFLFSIGLLVLGRNREIYVLYIISGVIMAITTYFLVIKGFSFKKLKESDMAMKTRVLYCIAIIAFITNAIVSLYTNNIVSMFVMFTLAFSNIAIFAGEVEKRLKKINENK